MLQCNFYKYLIIVFLPIAALKRHWRSSMLATQDSVFLSSTSSLKSVAISKKVSAWLKYNFLFMCLFFYMSTHLQLNTKKINVVLANVCNIAINYKKLTTRNKFLTCPHKIFMTIRFKLSFNFIKLLEHICFTNIIVICYNIGMEFSNDEVILM